MTYKTRAGVIPQAMTGAQCFLFLMDNPHTFVWHPKWDKESKAWYDNGTLMSNVDSLIARPCSESQLAEWLAYHGDFFTVVADETVIASAKNWFAGVVGTQEEEKAEQTQASTKKESWAQSIFSKPAHGRQISTPLTSPTVKEKPLTDGEIKEIQDTWKRLKREQAAAASFHSAEGKEYATKPEERMKFRVLINGAQ